MKKDKTNPVAAGKFDLSDDYLSRKAAGVEDDLVEVLPTRFRIGLGRAAVLASAVAVKGGLELFKLAKRLMKPRTEAAKNSVRSDYTFKKSA